MLRYAAAGVTANEAVGLQPLCVYVCGMLTTHLPPRAKPKEEDAAKRYVKRNTTEGTRRSLILSNDRPLILETNEKRLCEGKDLLYADVTKVSYIDDQGDEHELDFTVAKKIVNKKLIKDEVPIMWTFNAFDQTWRITVKQFSFVCLMLSILQQS